MPNGIKVYALSTCVHCAKAKQFLDDRGIEYDCIYVDRAWPDQRDQIMNEVRRLNPLMSFPTIVIGEKVIVGFQEQDLAEALGR